MNARETPLYVDAHDLARWVISRARSWPPERQGHMAPLIVAAACDLVTAVSLALTFPASRWEHVEQADRSIVRLRTLLRLARDLNLLSAGGLRFAAGRLQVIGRMIGGWKKKLKPLPRESEGARRDLKTGDGPPAAVTA